MKLFAINILALLCLCSYTKGKAQQPKLSQQISDRYWCYKNTTPDPHQRIYTFERVAKAASIKNGAGIYFKKDGTFYEIMQEKVPVSQPPRRGTWRVSGDTVKVYAQKENFFYKVLEINDSSFKCVAGGL